MKINIDEVHKITSLLLTKLKESNGNEVEIKNDYYWDISGDELYNPYEEPKDITLGQLSDDLGEIQRLIESDDAIMYDLNRLGNILKILSFEYPIAF